MPCVEIISFPSARCECPFSFRLARGTWAGPVFLASLVDGKSFLLHLRLCEVETLQMFRSHLYYFPFGMLILFLVGLYPHIFFTYQKCTLSSIMCYHLERMGDDGSFGWRAGTGWVPLGSLLESICGWASIALADITLKGRCLVKWPVQCHMNRCPANVCSHHHHGMCGSRSTNRVFSVGL